MTPESAEVLRLDGVAAGPIESALASGPLSAAFGRPLVVERVDGRFAARGTRPA